MKNTFILFLIALSFVCSSCNRTPSVEEPDVLKVELKETPVSVSDFFSKVEVIPLETSDSCLLARILRVRVSGDTTYILTQDYPTFRHITLMAFDKKGNYLRSIGRVGQGPGDVISFRIDVYLSFGWFVYRQKDIAAENELPGDWTDSGWRSADVVGAEQG